MRGKVISPSDLFVLVKMLLIGEPTRTLARKFYIGERKLWDIKKILAEYGITQLCHLSNYDELEIYRLYKPNCQIFTDKEGKYVIHINRRIKDKYPINVENFANVYYENDMFLIDIYQYYRSEALENGLMPYSLSHFSRLISKKIEEFAAKDTDATLTIDHKYGEYLELDWAGTKLHVLMEDGTPMTYQIFVATWSKSGFTKAVLVKSQKIKETCEALIKIIKYFDCKPKFFKLDNAKTFVSKHYRGHEPMYTKEFKNLCDELNICPDACDPYRPTQKSRVEKAVGLITSRCLSAFLKDVPGTYEEHSKQLDNLVNEFVNDRQYSFTKKTRAELFLEYEKKASRDLTFLPEYCDISNKILVGKTYHININRVMYSVPFEYIHKYVIAHIYSNYIEIRHGKTVIAKHDIPTNAEQKKVTKIEHMPKNHQIYVSEYISLEELYEIAKQCSPLLLKIIEVKLEHTKAIPGLHKHIYMFIKQVSSEENNYLMNLALYDLVNQEESIDNWNIYNYQKYLKQNKELFKHANNQLSTKQKQKVNEIYTKYHITFTASSNKNDACDDTFYNSNIVYKGVKINE